MQEHPDALDYDCMTMTGRTLGEYADMGADGLAALSHFVRHLGVDTATWRAVHGGDELPSWSTTFKTNAILADIYDEMACFRAEHAVKGSRKRPRRMKPYPRPNAQTGGGVGDGGVPVGEFDSWWAGDGPGK